MVDNNQRAWRIAQHKGNAGTWGLSRLAPWSWWSAEPYQRSEDSTWQPSGDTNHDTQGVPGNVPAPSTNKEKWVTHKKHRKMAKWELGEALEVRSKVAMALVIWTLVGTALMFWLAKGVYSWLHATFL